MTNREIGATTLSRLDWYLRANLKLRHFQLLVAMDELGSVSRVAVYLNVTQPAISKTLAQIEQGLQQRLFERTPRGLQSTEFGSCLIRHSRGILERLGAARDELNDIGEGRITRVSIGVLPAAACALVPHFIARLEAETTDLAVNVREGTMSMMLPALREGDIDLVVGALPERRLSSEFSVELLYEDPFVLAVRPGHPLATGVRLKWTMLSDFPMVLPPSAAFTRAAIDAFMADHQVKVSRCHVESVSTLTNLGVLQCTDSIGFLPSDVAHHFAGQAALEILPLQMPNLGMRVGLITMGDRQPTTALRITKKLLKDTALRRPFAIQDLDSTRGTKRIRKPPSV